MMYSSLPASSAPAAENGHPFTVILIASTLRLDEGDVFFQARPPIKPAVLKRTWQRD
jgi:hypothetical protein